MKKYFFKNIKEHICLFFIISFSLINIKKGYLLNKSYTNYFNKQIMWIFISVFLFTVINKIQFKKIFKLKYIFYLFNIFLLIYVLLFSKSINGVKAWINILGFSFQPSELIKITYPLATIKLFLKKSYILPTILFVIPFILIILEPDTGNAILLFIIYLYLLINNKNKKTITVLIIFLFILLSAFIIAFKYKPDIIIKMFNGKLYYRFERIINYKNNYQINNALIGIGCAKALPIPLNKIIIYIPEGLTDFMFAFHICNNGIMLGILLVLIYFYFTTLILKKYFSTKNKFKHKLIGSFLTVFTIQEIYNILMNIGLLPIMGIPLPFFSYGGSNIITYFIFYSLINKKISSIEDKDNNNYKNNYHMVQMDSYNLDKG